MLARRGTPGVGSSPRALRAAWTFGLRIEPGARPPISDRAALGALRRIKPGQIALLVGPSGAGKSTLLHAAVSARDGVVDAGRVRLGTDAAVDVAARALGARGADRGAEEAMRALALAGLGEARLFVTPADRLSEGQRARLRLLVAVSRARRLGGEAGARPGPPVALCDEFLATLDRFTARGVAAGVARMVREQRGGARASLIVATSHDDLGRALAPDLLVRLRLGGGATVERPRNPTRWARVIVGRGTYADYAALAPLHYRGGRPATIARVLKARVAGLDGPAGALVASMPAAVGSWRPSGGAITRARLRALNRSTRCISRVIVDPRCRGMGVASALVRAYLRSAPTRRTEAVAAMGATCPFFERAGMTRAPMGVRPHDARLLDALHRLGVAPEALALPARRVVSLALGTTSGAARRRRRAFLAREARVWAGSNISTASHRMRGLEALLALAGRRVRLGGMAYVTERGSRAAGAQRSRRAGRGGNGAPRRRGA